ncbi:peptidase M4 [Streptomyces sp. A0958]|uniref:PepSY domain-containing protein n=1 Tax=Streptomyces sp. A0958 TaxID=2563101 RepID=UPI00109E3EDE|nr:PepSY domain-containing protein [Streptomyces sp. A0958]THA70427.1 peptidase M4 [Streptomyces sp. A0958]
MKRKIVIAAVAAAVLAGGGAATAVALTDDDGHDSGSRGSSTASGATTARVTVGDAVAAGLRAVPGTVTEAELDEEDGGLVWELDVYGSDRAWHDVTVDAGSGKVLGKHVDHDDDGDRHAPRKTSVTLDEAVAAALKSAPGTVTSVELEGRRGGAAHWEVEVRGKDGKEHELDVDAEAAGAAAAGAED